MIKLITALLFTAMIGISYHATASLATVPDPEIQIDGNGYVGCAPDINCWTGFGQGNASFDINDLEVKTGYAPNTLELYYNHNVGGGEDGPFSDNYTTDTWAGMFGYANANGAITWDGGDSVTCPECFLVIKDGTDPYWYAFKLGGWNGSGAIEFRNFWLGNGEISHVSIYGGDESDRNIVPIPPAVWLFGSGLIGLVGVARRGKQ